MIETRIRQFHDLSLSEKSKYIQFISRLGDDGLKRMFKFPGEDFSLWWFSLVAEKPPYKTDSYNRLILFLLSKKDASVDAPNNKGSAKDVLCFQCLLGIYEFFRFLAKILYIKLCLRGFLSRKKRLSESDYVIVSYFPSIDNEAAKDNVFENQFIGPFHKLLDRDKKDGYSHILMQALIDDRGLRDAVKLARRFNEKQSLFFVEEFFKIKHLFLFAYYYSYFLLKFIMNLDKIKKAAVYEHEGSSYDIWHLMKNDFYRSFAGSNLAASIWYILLFKEIVGALNPKSRIVAVCEMQWWEKPLYIYARKRGLITVGYQHSVVPKLLLNYFNVEREMGNKDFVQNCPLPDYIATVGSIAAKQFIECGWQKDRIFIWGAQRFNSLKNIGTDGVPWKDRKDYIVAAFPIDVAESEKMLTMLDKAFKGRKYGIKIVLKGHPSQDLHKIVDRIGVKLSPEIFDYAAGSLSDTMRSSKGMIIAESSSAFYAVAQSLPVIIPRFMGKIDCNPLSYITDIPVYVYSPEALASACEDAVSSAPSAEYKKKCREIFNDYLYFPEDDHEYIEKVAALR